MNINQWTPAMHEQRIRDLRNQYVNVKASRHLAPAVKAEKLKSIARKGKSHATRLRGINVTVRQLTNVTENADYSGARNNGSIAWCSLVG